MSSQEKKIDPNLLLGTYDKSGSTEEHYRSLRELNAVTAVGALSLEVAGYERAQSSINIEYLNNVSAALPRIQLGAQLDVSTPLFSSYEAVGEFSGLEIKIDMGTALSEPDQEFEEGNATPEDIVSTRACAVWVNLPTEEAAMLTQPKRGAIADIEKGKIEVPCALIGHKATDDGFVKVLLMPFAIKRFVDSYGHSIPALRQSIVDPDSNSGLEYERTASIYLNREVLSVLMRDEQYLALIAMQESLMTESLTASDLNQMFDADHRTFNLSAATPKSVKMKPATTLRFKRPPRNMTELHKNEFDVLLDKDRFNDFTAEAFSEFHILEDTQRLCAMLGRGKAFEQAKDVLLARSLPDPRLKLLDS